MNNTELINMLEKIVKEAELYRDRLRKMRDLGLSLRNMSINMECSETILKIAYKIEEIAMGGKDHEL